MRKTVKLQIEMSEKREKINGLLGKDELSDEERAELNVLTKRAQEIEIELRAALVGGRRSGRSRTGGVRWRAKRGRGRSRGPRIGTDYRCRFRGRYRCIRRRPPRDRRRHRRATKAFGYRRRSSPVGVARNPRRDPHPGAHGRRAQSVAVRPGSFPRQHRCVLGHRPAERGRRPVQLSRFVHQPVRHFLKKSRNFVTQFVLAAGVPMVRTVDAHVPHVGVLPRDIPQV